MPGLSREKLGYDSAEVLLDSMTSDVKKNVGGVIDVINTNPDAKAALAVNDFVAFGASTNGDA